LTDDGTDGDNHGSQIGNGGGLPSIAMSALSFLDRNVLWIAPPLMCLAVWLLVFFIRSEIRLIKEAKILSVPLVEQQDIEFREAGRVVLSIEGPRFSTRFSGLAYELSDDYGAPVKGRRAWFNATTSGVKWVRMEMRVYEIPHPGRFVLRVQRLGVAQERDAEHRLVFMRPHLAQTVGYIICVILSFGLFIVSLVFFSLRLTGRDSAS
jgi:hypothetical protein